MIDILPRAIGSAFEDQAISVSYTKDAFGTMVRILCKRGLIELLFDNSTPTKVLLYRFDDYDIAVPSSPSWCIDLELHDPESIDKIRAQITKVV